MSIKDVGLIFLSVLCLILSLLLFVCWSSGWKTESKTVTKTTDTSQTVTSDTTSPADTTINITLPEIPLVSADTVYKDTSRSCNIKRTYRKNFANKYLDGSVTIGVIGSLTKFQLEYTPIYPEKIVETKIRTVTNEIKTEIRKSPNPYLSITGHRTIGLSNNSTFLGARYTVPTKYSIEYSKGLTNGHMVGMSVSLNSLIGL